MIGCQQKYCKYCVKPVFYKRTGKFFYGHCKISNQLIFECNPEEGKNYDYLPLYCDSYTPRKRKINY
jgi:hypothetical protein